MPEITEIIYKGESLSLRIAKDREGKVEAAANRMGWKIEKRINFQTDTDLFVELPIPQSWSSHGSAEQDALERFFHATASEQWQCKLLAVKAAACTFAKARHSAMLQIQCKPGLAVQVNRETSEKMEDRHLENAFLGAFAPYLTGIINTTGVEAAGKHISSSDNVLRFESSHQSAYSQPALAERAAQAWKAAVEEGVGIPAAYVRVC